MSVRRCHRRRLISCCQLSRRQLSIDSRLVRSSGILSDRNICGIVRRVDPLRCCQVILTLLIAEQSTDQTDPALFCLLVFARCDRRQLRSVSTADLLDRTARSRAARSPRQEQHSSRHDQKDPPIFLEKLHCFNLRIAKHTVAAYQYAAAEKAVRCHDNHDHNPAVAESLEPFRNDSRCFPALDEPDKTDMCCGQATAGLRSRTEAQSRSFPSAARIPVHVLPLPYYCYNRTY